MRAAFVQSPDWIVIRADHNPQGDLVLLLQNTDGDHNFGFYICRWTAGDLRPVFGAPGCFTSFWKVAEAFRRICAPRA